jgi:hypothetical protein
LTARCSLSGGCVHSLRGRRMQRCRPQLESVPLSIRAEPRLPLPSLPPQHTHLMCVRRLLRPGRRLAGAGERRPQALPGAAWCLVGRLCHAHRADLGRRARAAGAHASRSGAPAGLLPAAAHRSQPPPPPAAPLGAEALRPPISTAAQRPTAPPPALPAHPHPHKTWRRWATWSPTSTARASQTTAPSCSTRRCASTSGTWWP